MARPLLSDGQRHRLLRLFPLRHPSLEGQLVERIETALAEWLDGSRTRPQTTRETARQLEEYADAATNLVRASESLSEESRDELFGVYLGTRPHTEDPSALYRRLRRLLTEAASRSSRLGELAVSAAREARSGRRIGVGRPKDPAWRLAHRASVLWRELTDAPMTRGRGAASSPWEQFLQELLQVAGADVGGLKYARELAREWKNADLIAEALTPNSPS